MGDVKLAHLRDRLQPRWTEARASEVLAGLTRRRRRRRAAGWFLALSAVTLVAAATVGVARRERSAVHPALAIMPSPSQVAAARATSVTPLTPDTDLAADPAGAGRVFVLRTGAARFVVAHDANRAFQVHVGPVVIEDVGTIFSLVRLAGDRFEASVEEGRIRVRRGADVTELAAGERDTFDCSPDAPDLAAPAMSSGAPARADSLPPGSVPAWHRLAESGDYAGAYESLRKAGQGAVRDETQELLLAADAARLSGHPDGAVPFLERVLHAHGGDPRVELAAFTLGRVLLDELGRPAQAASAFERGRKLGGPLAEDALAREVESWSRAGETARAHSLALEYRTAYPRGRRSRAVAKFGGLE
jgi:transmembrane sensor